METILKTLISDLGMYICIAIILIDQEKKIPDLRRMLFFLTNNNDRIFLKGNKSFHVNCFKIILTTIVLIRFYINCVFIYNKKFQII